MLAKLVLYSCSFLSVRFSVFFNCRYYNVCLFYCFSPPRFAGEKKFASNWNWWCRQSFSPEAKFIQHSLLRWAATSIISSGKFLFRFRFESASLRALTWQDLQIMRSSLFAAALAPVAPSANWNDLNEWKIAHWSIYIFHYPAAIPARPRRDFVFIISFSGISAPETKAMTSDYLLVETKGSPCAANINYVYTWKDHHNQPYCLLSPLLSGWKMRKLFHSVAGKSIKEKFSPLLASRFQFPWIIQTLITHKWNVDNLRASKEYFPRSGEHRKGTSFWVDCSVLWLFTFSLRSLWFCHLNNKQ